MSMADSAFLIDAYPELQPDVNFERVAEEGYEGALIKSSQESKYVLDGFAAYYRRARVAMNISGVYHFLDDTATGRAQADHFLSTVEKAGGPDGKIIAANFENYASPPTNRIFHDFIESLRRHIPRRPVLVYSNGGFWQGEAERRTLPLRGEPHRVGFYVPGATSSRSSHALLPWGRQNVPRI